MGIRQIRNQELRRTADSATARTVYQFPRRRRTASWVIPTAVDPFLAGLVMDNICPNWVWYGAIVLALVAAGAHYLLLVRSKAEPRLCFELGGTD